MGPAPYHIRVAAGTSTSSDFAPTKRAATPNSIRTIVQPSDFFEFTLIRTSDH